MLDFIRRHYFLLLFGLLTAAFSGPGQTFLVSLFIPEIQNSLGLSRTDITKLYSLATLVSALLLPIMGRGLDYFPLRMFSIFVAFGLGLGCLLLSVSWDVWSLFIGFIVIRNMGQGSFCLISSTTMARVFGEMRGKALGLANMGYPISEAIFPYLVTLWIASYGWRSAWALLAITIAIICMPLIFFFLRSNSHLSTAQEFLETSNSTSGTNRNIAAKEFTVRQVLFDWRFYFLLLPSLTPAALLTAFFFHHGSIVEWKSWQMETIALGFVGFATSRAVLSFFSGPLVDRYSACQVFPYYLVPLAMGIACLWYGHDPVWSLAYLFFCGVCVGIGFTVRGALWAELYGTRHLGSIKGFITSLTVFSTAATPLIFSAALDRGYSFSELCLYSFLLCLLGTGLSKLACNIPKSTGVSDQ